ncbi:nitronate monooxygenase [Bacillus cereus]|nr:nitronate monooxygenase [Bacillus cereus]
MKWGIYLDFPQLKIGHMMPKVPIMQGGMGVGISLSKLAFANAGGIGIISGTGISIDEMGMHIRKAKEKIRKIGYIGVNAFLQ